MHSCEFSISQFKFHFVDWCTLTIDVEMNFLFLLHLPLLFDVTLTHPFQLTFTFILIFSFFRLLCNSTRCFAFSFEFQYLLLSQTLCLVMASPWYWNCYLSQYYCLIFFMEYWVFSLLFLRLKNQIHNIYSFPLFIKFYIFCKMNCR